MQLVKLISLVVISIWGTFAIHSVTLAQNTIDQKTANSNKPVSAVGMVGKINQIVIGGGELEALPVSDPMARIMVRIADTYRHGDAYRYDLEFTGFEPGQYDLAKSLRRKNPNDSTATIPPIEIEISSTLDPNRIEPSRPEPPLIPKWLTYFTKLNIFIGVWIAGLALIWRRSSTDQKPIDQYRPDPPTIAQQLKPLVQAACEGTIEPHRRAELESLLIAYWTDRLNCNQSVAPGEILSIIKQHSEAGPLMLKLEEWLHMPPGLRLASNDEITTLLKPYESVTDQNAPDFAVLVRGNK